MDAPGRAGGRTWLHALQQRARLKLGDLPQGFRGHAGCGQPGWGEGKSWGGSRSGASSRALPRPRAQTRGHSHLQGRVLGNERWQVTLCTTDGSNAEDKSRAEAWRAGLEGSRTCVPAMSPGCTQSQPTPQQRAQASGYC